MAIFGRRSAGRGKAGATDAGSKASKTDEEGNDVKKSFAQRKPANTAFKQQRLKAWQPILTPKTVLPTFFLLGLIFAPIGAVLYIFSNKVSEFSIDYTECNAQGATPVEIPSGKYSYQLHNANSSNFQKPQWAYVDDTTSPSGKSCQLYFSVPSRLEPPVFLYYKMTNYYQNHRRYVKSIDSDQLLGKNVALSTVRDGNCKPLGANADGKIFWPCGLIANSMFNDQYQDPVLVGVNPEQTYAMSESGIVWPGEKDKYKATMYTASQIVPPPLWSGRNGTAANYAYPNNYTDGNIFDPSNDEHFMVWMRTAGLPTFRKLYKRNDNVAMEPGVYRLVVQDNYPVSMFHGTKSIVFSTSSWVGGRNPFLGLAYIGVAGLCVLLGLIFTARHLIRPRKLGDMSYLSWNQNEHSK